MDRFNFSDSSIPLFPMPSAPPPTSFHPSPASSSSSPSSSPRAVPISREMKSVRAVEKLLKYSFKNKTLLEEALTHNSHAYQRFEFIGDSAIGLALSNYFYLAYPKLEPHELSQLRSANVSTEKFARLALIHGLYPYLLHHCPSLDAKVKEFEEAVKKEDGSAVYGGLVKAPKVLADLFESVAGAVYVDVDFDLQIFWVIYRALLEPMFTLDNLQKLPQPVSMLFRICGKHDKRIDIRYSKDGQSSVATVYLDDELFTSASAENNNIAKLIAAKEAVKKLVETLPVDMNIDEAFYEDVELENAKRTLYEICSKKKWPKPIYSVEEVGSVSAKQYVCEATIAIKEGTLYMKGDEMSRKKEAENSSAYHMVRALRHSKYLK